MKFLRVGLVIAMLVGSMVATVGSANAQGFYVNRGFNNYYNNGWHNGWNNPYNWRRHQYWMMRRQAEQNWRWNRWHANRRWGWY